jgi:hypothetical protein
MKPLASPVAEYRLAGIAQLAGGLLFGVVGAVVAGPVAAAAGLVLAGVLFATGMYRLAYRRYARAAVDGPAAAPTTEREPAGRTRRRVAVTSAALLIYTAAVALWTRTPALVGGIVAGNGAALMLTSRRLRDWEHEHDSRLLREPRWRWSRSGSRGWGRGRGMMDPQDFYVVSSTDF